MRRKIGYKNAEAVSAELKVEIDVNESYFGGSNIRLEPLALPFVLLIVQRCCHDANFAGR